MSMSDPARSQRDGSRSPSMSGTGPARLAAYLAAGVGASLVGTPNAEAAVVAINLTNVGGQNITAVNAGLSSGGSLSIANWLGPGTGGTIKLFNDANVSGDVFWGLSGGGGLEFATSSFANPVNFGVGTSIGPTTVASFSSDAPASAFRWVYSSNTYNSPNFGAGSFMGFRFGSLGSFNYGYLEVTWNSSTNTFQILSGAYESTVNTGILAGATPSAVPGAGLSAMALMALGGGAFRRRSRDRVA